MTSSEQFSSTDIEALAANYANTRKLSFDPSLEEPFCSYRRESFLNINHSLLLLACIVYLTFVLTDYAVVPSEYFPYIALTRVALAALMFLGYFFIKIKENTWARRHVFSIISVLMLLVSAHVCISTYFLPHPFAEIFILGIVQLYIVVPAVLKPHSKLSLATMIGILVMTICALFLPERPAFTTDSRIINDLLANYTVSYTLFLSGLIFLSAYTAFSYEKMLRQNWLEHQLTMIQSKNLTELSEKFKALSHKDELTQLHNRRSFRKHLQRAVANLRAKQPLSLIMIDVDNFKAYNDIYGHQQGDDCLSAVAEHIEKTCQRSTDITARYGGEEFMVILPATDAHGAYTLAESIRERIARLNITHLGSEHGKVTVSLGVVTMHGSQHITADNIIKRVDDALYTAKSNGRNTVVVAQDSIVQTEYIDNQTIATANRHDHIPSSETPA